MIRLLIQATRAMLALEPIRSWAHALTILNIIHRLQVNTHRMQTWTKRLTNRGIDARSYTFEFHHHRHVVYAKISPNYKLSYIGMTSKTVQGRENSRKRKTKQISQEKLVQAELALRWWHRTGSYDTFATIVVHRAATRLPVITKEQLLIQRWQPELNFPWILRLPLSTNPFLEPPTPPIPECRSKTLAKSPEATPNYDLAMVTPYGSKQYP